MEACKTLSATVDEKELRRLLGEGWHIAGTYTVTDRGSGNSFGRMVLTPPVQFETLRMESHFDSVKFTPEGKSSDLKKRFEELGNEGWELVSTCRINDANTEFWFKRQKRTREKFVSQAGTDGPTVS